MRLVALLLLLLGAALSGGSSVAGPPPPGGGGRPGYGGGHWGGGGHGHWGGGYYRPVYGPVYGRGFYGYPGYGYGLGFGWGYGAGWALSAGYPWVYGGAPAYWGYPYAGHPYGYRVTTVPALTLSEDLVFVQQAPVDAAIPAPQQPAAGYWYYCTGPAGYYPYVQQCNKPWIAVQPQAATPAR